MPQNVAQALQAALSRGLPYAGDFRRLVEQHMTDLVQDMPSLHIKTREYTHIDGRTVELLLAEGTVPMYYQGVKYNIPVAIWLPEQYPLAAPLVYVVPTPDMVIKPRHTFVDASGLVSTMYIARWQYPTSNLREMAQDMSMHFGDDPPLFSKPKNWSPPPPQGYPTYGGAGVSGGGAHGSGAAAATAAGGGGDVFHAHNPLAQASSNSFTSLGASGSSFTSAHSGGAKPPVASTATAASSGSGGGFDSVWDRMMAATSMHPPVGQAQQAAVQPPPPVVQPPPPPPPRDDPLPKLAEAFRSAAVATLNKRLQASLTAIAQQAAAEAEEQQRLQATLRQRGEQLQSEVAALQAERVALDKLSQDLAASSSQLDRWLAENEHLARAADDPSQLDPDAVIKAADPLSQQALEVQAQDLALEDALYALDKSLNAGAVEPDAYLKQVRAICRRQMFVRTIGNKIAAAQQEQQRHALLPPPLQQQQQPPQQQARMPQGVQRSLSGAGRPVVLPQGDSWANAGIIASSGGSNWYPS